MSPSADGYARVTALRGPPVDSDAPILMVSTAGEPLDAERAYAAGANPHLVKPVDPVRLVRLATLYARHGTPEREPR